MSYGGYHTRQEQEDVMAAQITNPNRVGSGFIDLGPMQRIPQANAAANWQTQSLLGGGSAAPPQLADIWGKEQAVPQPPPGMPQMALRPPVNRSQQMQPQLGGANAFAPAAPASVPASVGGINGMFNSFSIDPATQARALASQKAQHQGQQQAHAQAQAAAAQAAAQQARSFTAMQPSLQQPFLNGGTAAPAPPAPQAPPGSLMSMLNTPPPPPPAPSLQAPGLNTSGFAGLGNGSVPAVPPSRVQAAFNQPPVPAASSFGAVPNAFGAAPSCRPAPPTQPVAPKTLSSAADYGAAAAAWKPPTMTSTVSTASVARKPEAATTGSARTLAGGTTARPEAAAEWECRRCTFLNNGALWECEMCGFERPGKEAGGGAAGTVSAASTPRANHEEDGGWKPAGRVERKPQGGGQPMPSAPGKSKAQAKNEKRRAKKRDGFD